MANQIVQPRQTKYVESIQSRLAQRGHATNIELLNDLRSQYPELSATTIHRATARLASRGEISVAPSTKDGSTRYDHNLKSHDHFLCTSCDQLRDTDVKSKIAPILEESIGDCQISGRLTVSGVCKQCINPKRKDK